jgi:hypothetical protein
MNEWLDELADELGVARMTNEEVRALLGVTREVAHRVERRFAPLAAFMIGAAVGRGAPFVAATEAAERLLPEAGPG